MSGEQAVRWWDRFAVSPRSVLLFGAVVALLTSVVLVLCLSDSRQANPGVPWGALILLVPFLATPTVLCAASLWLASEHPLLPWVKGQVQIVLVFGFAVLLADVAALIALGLSEEDIGYGVFFMYGIYGQLILWGASLLGLRILVYLLRWHLGARPDGWRDPEEGHGGE